MVLYFVGLGLSDHKDITLRGLEILRKCKRVFLEAYTSTLMVSTAQLEESYGCMLEAADRELVELQADTILEDAADEDVAFCVAGDPFGATTHTDLLLRAHERGIEVRTVHNASIINAVGACGLQLYKFGQTVSIVFFTESWRPQSFYDKIAKNRASGHHTLCLLDIKVKEPSLEALARGRVVYEPPRYMTIATALSQLLEIEAERGERVLCPTEVCVGVARLGSQSQAIVAGTPQELMDHDFGNPLHSLVICGELDDMERQMLALRAIRHHIAPQASGPL